MSEVSIGQIRDIINLTDPDQLPDAKVQSAIDRAEAQVSHLASLSSIPNAIIELAKKNLAAYLAYQTYADRIVEVLPGQFDQAGVFQPIGNPVGKQVMAKLAGLKTTSDEILDLIRNTPLEADQGETPGPSDLENYPDSMKLSNLDTVW